MRLKALKILLMVQSIGVAADVGCKISPEPPRLSPALIRALIIVESGGRDFAKGDYNKKTGEYMAIGCLQIHRIYLDDVNRILGKRVYTEQDRFNREKSKEMVIVYLTYWSKHNKIPLDDNYNLARIHNGGSKGHKKETTKKYAEKVLFQLKKGKK